jgi:hypothetical protein
LTESWKSDARYRKKKGIAIQITQLLSDSALGLIGGYVGTKVMEPVSMKLYPLELEANRQQEDQVRPGSPYEIAARKTAARLSFVNCLDKEIVRC